MAKRRIASRFVRLVPQEYSIGDFLTDEEIADMVLLARHRVIGAFHHAYEIHNGRKKGTDNFIRGVEPKVSELARYVQTWMKDPFIKPHQLEELIDVDSVSPSDCSRLIHQLMFEVIMMALNIMCVKPPKTPQGFIPEECSDEIWYDSVRCYWQIKQSSVDEYTTFRRNMKRLWNNNRSFHGRVRSQSKRRNVPEGVSVGFN